jgi:hypothetical protein
VVRDFTSIAFFIYSISVAELFVAIVSL